MRYYAGQLEKATGQKFVIENKVGANGKIATDTTLMAKPQHGWSPWLRLTPSLSPR